MNHSFDVDIAVKFGLQEAIFIENLRFWIAKNKANNKHFYQGKYWTYNSAKAYAELFPYWSKQQVERIILKLKLANVIEIGHFSVNTYDRTNWYSLNEEMLSSKSMNGSIEIDESTNTDINQIVNKGAVLEDETNLLFETFWKAYPNKKAKDSARKSFAKLKPTNDTLCLLQQAVEHQKRTIWKDKDPQYIPHAATWINGKRWEDEVQAPVNGKSAYDSLLGGL